MSDSSTAGSSTPPPAPQGFPSMPKNPGAALGMASGYFGGTSPSGLVTHAVLMFVLATVIGCINGFISHATVSNILSFPADILRDLGLVVLVVGAARFVSDAFRARG